MRSGTSLLTGVALVATARLAKRVLESARSGELQDFVSKLGTGEALNEVRARIEAEDAAEARLRRRRRQERERTPAPA